MNDPREAILARMAELIIGLPGLETAARNLDEVSDLKLPCAILYDGDEEASPNNLRAVGLLPNVIHAVPQVIITMQEVPETVGATVNEWRAKLLNAILADEALQNLCGSHPHAGVRYVGCSTSLVPGRSSQSSLIVHFSVAYHFIPTQLP